MGKKIELSQEIINHIIELYKSGLTHRKISLETGIDENKIRRTLQMEKVPARDSSFYLKMFNKFQEDDIIKKYISGANMNVLAKEYNCSQKAIRNVLNRNNIEHRSPSEAYRTYTINDYYFDEIDNQDKAYMLGFLYADGHNCSKYEIHHYDIGMTLQMEDKYILDEMCKRMGMNRGASIIINSTNGKPYARMNIMNKHIVYRLDELGVVPNKTRKTEFPFWMREELYSHFIRGLLDGDGCIPKRLDRVSFCGSRNLMCGLSEVIRNNLGFKPNVGDYKQSKGISYVQVCSIQKRLPLLDWIYKDADMKLTRKYDLYLKMNEIYRTAS